MVLGIALDCVIDSLISPTKGKVARLQVLINEHPCNVPHLSH